MREVVAVDIGGTHARFAIAKIEGKRVAELGAAHTLRTADHASFETAWTAFASDMGRPLPKAAAISIASPIAGDVLKLTNHPWIIRPSLLPERLGVDELSLVNDFAAVAHAVAQVEPRFLTHLCGPDVPLPAKGVTSIVGPGTGLGVGCLLRQDDHYHVIPTEGGHTDFAPLDSIEDAILRHLRARHRRVSVERVVSGPGIVAIYEVLEQIESRPFIHRDDKSLWEAALTGQDALAVTALDRFCLSLGAAAGDVALAQGAVGVVIAGGIGLRLADHLPRSGFRERFVAKGRFEQLMGSLPVKIITHEQPGLFGAAAAFAQEHGA